MIAYADYTEALSLKDTLDDMVYSFFVSQASGLLQIKTKAVENIRKFCWEKMIQI